jgi:hypothetical protein
MWATRAASPQKQHPASWTSAGISLFTVAVSPGDRNRVGEGRQSRGRIVEKHAPVKEWDGRAEIAWQEPGHRRGGIRLPSGQALARQALELGCIEKLYHPFP